MINSLPKPIEPVGGGVPAAWDEAAPVADQRGAPRFNLLIRAAKLIAGAAEFLVVIRDVSQEGIKVRAFHPLPNDGDFAIELASGERHAVDKVWEEGELKGFRFRDPVGLEKLLAESPIGKRKRSVRLRLNAPIEVFAGTRRTEALFLDISQSGACIASDDFLAIDERVRIQCAGLPELTGRVRWRRRPLYGLNFEQTFRFDELARLTAQLTAAGD